MRGFQPSKAPAKAKKCADGGLVRGPGTGTSDEVPDEVPDGTFIMPADSTAKIGPDKLAMMGQDPSTEAEEPEEPGEATEGETAAQESAEEAGEAMGVPDDGEMNDQEGTGPGQKVPVQLSNGEFKMSPEQLQAIGAAVMNQLKTATHAPVRGFNAAQASNEDQTRSLFADGGQVKKRLHLADAGLATKERLDEEGRVPNSAPAPPKSNFFPQNSQDAGAGIYGGLGTEPGSSGKFTQVPPGIIGQQPTKPAPAPAASQVAAPAAPPVAAPRGLPNVTPATTGTTNQQSSGSVGFSQDQVQGLYQKWQDTKTPWYLPTPKANYEERAAESEYTNALKNQYAGPPAKTSQVALPPQATAPAMPTATAPAPAAVTPPGAITPPAVTTQAPTPPPQAAQVMPGIYRSGNSYSDSAAGAVTGAAPSAQPSAQNLAAAEALAQRSQQESMARVLANMQGQQQGQPQFTQRGFSSSQDPAAIRERKALIDALSTPMKGAQNGQLTAAQRQGMLGLKEQEARAVQAAASNDTSLQQTQMQTGTQRDVAAMREVGDTGRAVMRETGETGRASSRNAIDAGRLGLETQVRGFDIRKGLRDEKLWQEYEAADTPEKKAAATQKIRDSSGKGENIKDNFMTVGGGQEWDAAAGVMRNVPQRLVDLRTQKDVGAQTKQMPPINENPQAQAIKNNANMSREQKAAALKQLGY